MHQPQAGARPHQRPGRGERLLRLANSAYFGVPGEVACAATAIRVVGHRRLRALLCHLIAGKLLEILRLDIPIVEQVRQKALAAAAVCGDLGEPVSDGDALRVAGLLHNIGELALASEFPKEFAAAKDAVESFGVRYEAAAAALLQAWRMPSAMAEAASLWRTAPFKQSNGPGQRAVDAVHVGATLAESWIEQQTAATAVARVQEDVIERLALKQVRLHRLYDRIPAGVHEMETML